jgi:hypothetical protein
MNRNSQRPLRRTKHGILIQCEGQKTEPRYLYEFSSTCGATQRFAVTVKPGKGQNAMVTMEAAVREGNRTLQGVKVYNEIWCVLDVEHAAHEAKLTEALALARQKDIRVCLSNPSFEVWLLAHFERITRSFEDSAAVERRLSDAFWQREFGVKYDKGDERLYERLASRRDDAIAHAKWALETFHENRPCREANASTEVYRLMQRLQQ